MSDLVSVIIVNYNTQALSLECVQSVLEHTNGVDLEVLLVDNASSDFKAEPFSALSSKVSVIRNEANLGFAKGVNTALEHAHGNYVLLVNSDARLLEDSIPVLIKALQNDPAISFISCEVVGPEGSPQPVSQEFPGLGEVFRGIAGKFTRCRDSKFSPLVTKRMAHKTDWLWGTFVLFRRHLLLAFPGEKLPDDFFLYCEDVQWAYELRKRKGLYCYYCPETKVVHYLSKSSDFAPKEKYFKYILPNTIQFLSMYHGPAYVWAYKLLYLFGTVPWSIRIFRKNIWRDWLRTLKVFLQA